MTDTPRHAILVALTFDRTGRQALLRGAALAALQPASQLHVVHVIAENGEHARAPSAQRLELTPAELTSYVREASGNPLLEVTAHVRVGAPARAILRSAAEIKAEVIVVGTHRRSGMKKLMLGSVAEQVLQHAHCPVFIAVPTEYGDEPQAEPTQTRCPRCQSARQRSHGEQLWCEKHARARGRRNQAESSLQLPDRMHYRP
jgi:nucleotide-binding universal stress UspA family protein